MSESNLFCRTLDWLRARAAGDTELATLSAADLHMLAADIGVTHAELLDIVPGPGDHTELMDQMMRARGLDPKTVRHAFAGMARDMEVTCARCGESRVCRRELAANTAGAHAHAFCGNAGAMDDLLATAG